MKKSIYVKTVDTFLPLDGDGYFLHQIVIATPYGHVNVIDDAELALFLQKNVDQLSEGLVSDLKQLNVKAKKKGLKALFHPPFKDWFTDEEDEGGIILSPVFRR
jgi:hypothetical protein